MDIQSLIKQGLVIYGAVKPAMNRYYLVLLGLALGMLIGILIVPVYFRPNAEPVKMDETYRDQWIKDTANGFQFVSSFAESGLVENPEQLRASAENEVRDKLTAVGATPADIDALIAENEGQVYLEQSLEQIRPYAVEVEGAAQQQQDDAQIPGTFARVLTTIGIFVLFGILGALITLYFKLFDIPFLKQIMNIINPREEDPSLAAARARKDAREQAASLRTEFDSPPVVQFMSTYLNGDNYYDDSFAIELDDEMKTFLGECGAGISESVTIDGNKKVLATEVWLFDKNDISTITKVLVSEAAYNDQDVRAKLAPRGDLIVANEGARIILETQTLKMQATVVSLKYDTEAEQPNHVYDKVTVELAVWQKEGVAAAGGDDDGMPKPLIDVDAYLAEQEQQKQPAAPVAAPMTQAAPPPVQPISPPPVQQQTQPVRQQQPPTGPTPAQQPPQFSPQPPQQPMRQQGPPPQAAPPQPQFPAQPPQQPMRQPGPPPQAAPPQRQPGPPPPQQGQRPPMPPQQGGSRPQFPAQQPRPPMPQQSSGQRPPMPPQQQQRHPQDDSPFGDTGDFNLQ